MDYINFLDTIWCKVLSEYNITSAFRSTRIFSPDRTKYPASRFNKEKLECYNQSRPGTTNLTPKEMQESVLPKNKLSASIDNPSTSTSSTAATASLLPSASFATQKETFESCC